MSRSRGKSLGSLSPFVYTGHNTPSVQLLGSALLIQTCWIYSCNASTRLGPPFFNSSTAIEFCCFAGISAPFLFPHGSANQCQLHHLSNWLNVLVAPIWSLHSSVLQKVLSISPALGFCWLISHLWFERSSNVIQVLVKFTRVLNTPMSLNLD
jgi:hypothetical protein